MKNTRKVKKAMDDYTKDYLSTYTTGIRAVKYNKELQFFSERRNMVIDALEKFLLQTEAADFIRGQQTTYIATFLRLMRAS